VRDVVPALVALLERPACHGRVFNLGSDEPISILNLAHLVNRTLGSDAGVRLIPYDEAFGPGFEDLRQRRPDLTLVRQAIGFSPGIPLSRTILDVADEARGAAAVHARAAAPRAADR
jgi:UDP-glucose 4-epimerase